MRPAPRRRCGYPHCRTTAVSYKGSVRRALIAIAAGLALADAAVVTLALPPLLLELDTTVEGVAAVIAVYTAVLALALPISAALHSRATGAAGALLFAAASIGCASADSLEMLLAMRALQALGASALLAAAFDALDGGGAGRRLWVGAAVAGTAAGPALGGALTELFDWRAIFVAQAPIALAAAPALAASPIATVREALPRPPRDVLAAVALALISGALTAVVFLLVLLLISGWSVEPLAAAAAVTVLPLAAVAGSLVRGAPAAARSRGLRAGGRAGSPGLALLPEASAFWTLTPAAARGLRDGHGVPGARGRAAARAHARPGGRAAVAAPRGHHAGAGGARADRGRRAGRPGAARARARHGAGAGRRPAADRQDRAGAAAVRQPGDRGPARRARAGARARAPPGRPPGTATCSAASSASTASSAAGASCSAGSSSSRTSTASTLDEAARGLDRLLGTDRAEGLLDDLREGAEGSSTPQQLGASCDRLGADLDDVVLAAVDAAFSPAFAVTGAMALLAALLLLFRLRGDGAPRAGRRRRS